MEHELTTQGYAIKDFDLVKQQCREFIAKTQRDILVTNVDDERAVKNARTEIRRKKKEISDYRKAFVASMVGKIEKQLKELEKMLDDSDVMMKKHLDDYAALLEDKPAETYQITIISESEDDLAKVIELAKSLKCKIKK